MWTVRNDVNRRVSSRLNCGRVGAKSDILDCMFENARRMLQCWRVFWMLLITWSTWLLRKKDGEYIKTKKEHTIRLSTTDTRRSTPNSVEATLSNATSWTILSTVSNVASTLLPFRQQCCRFRQQCRTKFRPFDNVETNWSCSICFDFVERTKFYSRIVRHCCRLWQQSRMLLRHSLLLVWTGP